MSAFTFDGKSDCHAALLCRAYEGYISLEICPPKSDKNVVAEEMPAANTPVNRITPRNVGRIFIAAQINTCEGLSNFG